MKKIEGNPSLYERIENLKKSHEWDFDKLPLPTLPTLPSDLTNCNNADNSVAYNKSQALPGRYRESTPKQDPCPVAVPDAELISRDLQYLDGVTVDLTGWTLWKRIEQGKERRFALDAAGVIRWERWYLRKEME